MRILAPSLLARQRLSMQRYGHAVASVKLAAASITTLLHGTNRQQEWPTTEGPHHRDIAASLPGMKPWDSLMSPIGIVRRYDPAKTEKANAGQPEDRDRSAERRVGKEGGRK